MRTFTARHRAEAERLFAFGNPPRLKILRALAPGARRVADLARDCGIKHALAVAHLATLERVGLVAIERVGPRVLCSLAGALVRGDVIEFTGTGVRVAVPCAPAGDPRAEAAWFAALGTPARVAIVRALAGGTKVIGAVASAARLLQATTSTHVRVLRHAGVIEADPVGRHVRCSLTGARVTAGAVELRHPHGARVTLPRA